MDTFRTYKEANELQDSLVPKIFRKEDAEDNLTQERVKEIMNDYRYWLYVLAWTHGVSNNAKFPTTND